MLLLYDLLGACSGVVLGSIRAVLVMVVLLMHVGLHSAAWGQVVILHACGPGRAKGLSGVD